MAKTSTSGGRSRVQACRLMAHELWVFSLASSKRKSCSAFIGCWPTGNSLVGPLVSYRSTKLSIFVTMCRFWPFCAHVAGGAVFLLGPYPRAVSGMTSHYSTLILLHFFHPGRLKNQLCRSTYALWAMGSHLSSYSDAHHDE